MANNMLFLHVAAVTLFLILLIFKTFLLLINKKEFLAQIRDRSKAIDLVLGISILISGAYLLIIIGSISIYIIAKIVLVLIAIPLGIFGLKKDNKILATLSVLIFIYVYAIAETKNIALKNGIHNSDINSFQDYSDHQANEILREAESATLQQGKVIFKVLCVECHGENGQKEIAGTGSLATSKLGMEEQITIIAEGRGEMSGFEAELSEHEIELVAAYTKTLKQ